MPAWALRAWRVVRVLMAVSFHGKAYTTPPTTLFVPGIADHGPFFRPDGLDNKCDHQHRVAAAIMSIGSAPGVNDHADQPRPAPRRKALLVSDANDAASVARGEGLAGMLASQGFSVSLLEGGAAARTLAGLSEVDARVTVPFDLCGRAGEELTNVCEATGVAGLYTYKSATGMFKKVRGLNDIVHVTAAHHILQD